MIKVGKGYILGLSAILAVAIVSAFSKYETPAIYASEFPIRVISCMHDNCLEEWRVSSMAFRSFHMAQCPLQGRGYDVLVDTTSWNLQIGVRKRSSTTSEPWITTSVVSLPSDGCDETLEKTQDALVRLLKDNRIKISEWFGEAGQLKNEKEEVR